MITGYKALAWQLGSPIQGGGPIFDGTLPYTLPKVAVDTGLKNVPSAALL